MINFTYITSIKYQIIMIMFNEIIHTIPNFLTNDEIDDIIHITKTRSFKPSCIGGEIKDGKEVLSIQSPTRTSYTAGIMRQENLTIQKIEQRIAYLFNLDIEHIEPLQIECFEHGQFFKPCYHTKAKDVLNTYDGGIRIYSITIFLNTVLDSGYMNFPRLNHKLQPIKGTAVIWKNVVDDFNNIQHENKNNVDIIGPLINKLTLVEHEPVFNDVKYILNIWTRQNKFIISNPIKSLISPLTIDILKIVPYESLVNIACFIFKTKLFCYQDKLCVINSITDILLNQDVSNEYITAFYRLITSDKTTELDLYKFYMKKYVIYMNNRLNIYLVLKNIIINYLI